MFLSGVTNTTSTTSMNAFPPRQYELQHNGKSMERHHRMNYVLWNMFRIKPRIGSEFEGFGLIPNVWGDCFDAGRRILSSIACI